MIFEIPLKACGCGVLAGEQCDCLQFAASAEQLFQGTPYVLPTTRPRPALADEEIAPHPFFAAMAAAVIEPGALA